MRLLRKRGLIVKSRERGKDRCQENGVEKRKTEWHEEKEFKFSGTSSLGARGEEAA